MRFLWLNAKRTWTFSVLYVAFSDAVSCDVSKGGIIMNYSKDFLKKLVEIQKRLQSQFVEADKISTDILSHCMCMFCCYVV